ncbi:MAG: hypothetical protein HYZ34_08430 [Ignavibacteriae bacterium]|nr:hypothetical protein [Ignavibacteriota bacterium]
MMQTVRAKYLNGKIELLEKPDVGNTSVPIPVWVIFFEEGDEDSKNLPPLELLKRCGIDDVSLRAFNDFGKTT